MAKITNIFSAIPADLTDEVFETLIQSDKVKIERIVSKGHTSPATGWYQQSQHEWVLVLQGEGHIQFEDHQVRLKTGDYLNIAAGVKHKVSFTSTEPETIWLGIFY